MKHRFKTIHSPEPSVTEFKVKVNGVLIRRQWPWSRISRVKDELKRMGFRWNPEESTWIGSVERPKALNELKELLGLTSKEFESIAKPLLKASIKVPNPQPNLRDCMIGNNAYIPCVAKAIAEQYFEPAGDFNEYLRNLIGKVKESLGVDDPQAFNEALKILELDRALREFYERRIEWRIAELGNGIVRLNFLARGLIKSLRDIRIPYNIVDKEGNIKTYEIPVIGKDDVYKEGDKWVIRFPVFERDNVAKLLRSLGYVVREVPWSPRSIKIPYDKVALLNFQERALEAWVKNGYRGTVVIPTGGGKTFIALKAIAKVKVPTVILVVTEELMNQWYERLRRLLGIDAGRLGGGFDDVKDVTVAIYNSAVKRINDIRDRFDLAVFDECLPYNSLIITDRGPLPIGDIVEGRLPVRVLTHRGRFMRVVKYFKIPLVKRLVKVIHEGGELVATEDHLILTDGGWKPAALLKRGDIIYFHSGQSAQGQLAGHVEASVGAGGQALIQVPEGAVFRPVHVLDVVALNEDSSGSSHTYVYDLEVEEDHSFVADGVVVHNCHHVPAETFKNVAFKLTAPYRLALSATPTRKDGNETLIYETSGGIVYKASYVDMIHEGLVVPVRHYRIYTKLSDEEVKEYRSISDDNPIKLRNVAAQAKSKIPIAVKIAEFEESMGSKVLLFTQYIEQAEAIYEELKARLGAKVALVTSKTSNRDEIFERFRLGHIKVLVTTTVLDEGVDVPDADVAIIVSGTGSQRQMVQRIGRVVRKTEGKYEARVYEIVAKGTIEEALSSERHANDEVYEKECRKVDEKDLDNLLNRVKSILSRFKGQERVTKYMDEK